MQTYQNCRHQNWRLRKAGYQIKSIKTININTISNVLVPILAVKLGESNVEVVKNYGLH